MLRHFPLNYLICRIRPGISIGNRILSAFGSIELRSAIAPELLIRCRDTSVVSPKKQFPIEKLGKSGQNPNLESGGIWGDIHFMLS